MNTRRVYPQLGEPFTLTQDCTATLIHATSHAEEPGHILEAGWTLREEIRTDLPAGERAVVRHEHGGLVGRYFIRRAELT